MTHGSGPTPATAPGKPDGDDPGRTVMIGAGPAGPTAAPAPPGRDVFWRVPGEGDHHEATPGPGSGGGGTAQTGARADQGRR